MEKIEALEALSALAQATRLDVFQWLIRHEPEGLSAGEIGEHLGVAPNTLSSHLAILTRTGLTTSERRGRTVIYRASPGRLGCLIGFLSRDCCGGHPEQCDSMKAGVAGAGAKDTTIMPERVYNVLFLCTGNSARSIIAESILNKEGAGRFKAYSAGSHPKGEVHPFALQILDSYGYPTEGARSKSWDEFAAPDAPQMDFVFTVCDNAAGEACPVWPGQPITAHWGIEDPAAVTGTDIEKKTAFVTATRYLKNRISNFVSLPLASLDRMAVVAHLRDIGMLEGATQRAGGTR